MFLKELDNGVVYPYDYRSDYPDMTIISENDIPEYGIYWVFPATMPLILATEKTVEADPVKIEGRYHQRWQVINKTPEEIRQLVPVVTMNQFEIALFRTGDLELVKAAIAEIGGEAEISWRRATEVRRESVLVNAIAEKLGKSEDEVNQLFQLAATL
jgi:hypothetical protein